MYDCRYWLWLSLGFEPGAIKCDKLLQAFDYNPKAIYEADKDLFLPFCEKNPRLLSYLTNKNLDQVYKTLEFCEKNNVGLLTYDDDKYPSSLRRIQGQPTVIYYKGTVPDFSNRLTLGIVGTRNVTSYGVSAAYTISHDLATANTIVVSGMALGTDTAAHRGALDAKGTTVAFLGCGINVVYPKENARMMDEIIETGAVMTDYPPSSRPEGRHFPVRNRLISGISNGVLIVEAAKRSGALITAEHAVKQGKMIYAIPGRIGELTSEGTNALLISGARTVTKSADILDDFRYLYDIKETKNQSGFSKFSTPEQHDLNTPYKTPAFNPYATNKSGFTAGGESGFYSKFKQMPKEKKEPQPKPVDPNIEKWHSSDSKLPRYVDISKELPSTNMSFDKPKPVIIYSDFDDDEHAKAYMSMSAEEKAELEELEMMAHRPILKYPDEPMPPGGYKIKLTKEKEEYYAHLSEDLNRRRFDTGGEIKVKTPLKNVINDLHELKRISEAESAIRMERLKQKAEGLINDAPSYEGLTNIEIKVLQVLENGERVTVDAMSHLGIPLPKLLSVLTVLEIKHRITQFPGGYFEINRDY